MLNNNDIFVCGAGHQGLSMAAYLAMNGNKVSLWNRTADNIEKIVQDNTIFCDGIIKGTAKIQKASSNIEDVVKDIVMVTVPSNAHRDVARCLAPYVHKDMIILLNPGRTFGAAEFYYTLKNFGVSDMPHIAETQTIVYTCRKRDLNHVSIFALKNNVGISSLYKKDEEFVMSSIPECIKDRFVFKDSIAYTSFSNVGMILHCAPVLMNIGWIETEKTQFKYYYDGISKTVSGFLEKMDKERVEVARKMGYIVDSVSDWMKKSYNIEGDSLYEVIQNNDSYRLIDAPPTLDSRYLFEDIPNGLVPIEFLGKEIGVNTDNISLIIDLASSVLNVDFRKIGRQFCLKDLIDFL